MIVECKGGIMDGYTVEMRGYEHRWYSRTHDGRFKEHVYRFALKADGEKWMPILDFVRTEIFAAETCERIA
jgi:hypothetical protein